MVVVSEYTEMHLKPIFLFLQLHCCGVSNFSDWQATPWGEGHGPGKMPPSCCRWTQAGVCGPRENERGVAELYPTVSLDLWEDMKGRRRVVKSAQLKSGPEIATIFGLARGEFTQPAPFTPPYQFPGRLIRWQFSIFMDKEGEQCLKVLKRNIDVVFGILHFSPIHVCMY